MRKSDFLGFLRPERHGLKRQKEARKAGLSSYFALQFMGVNARIGAAGKVAAKARFGKRQGKTCRRRKKPMKTLEKGVIMLYYVAFYVSKCKSFPQTSMPAIRHCDFPRGVFFIIYSIGWSAGFVTRVFLWLKRPQRERDGDSYAERRYI